ncbi:MAG: ATP-binding protein [archaeon]
MRPGKSFIIFILLFIPLSLVPAQEYIIDSLKNELKNATSDSLRMFLLTELTYQYINIDTDQARVYCEKMLKETERTTCTYEKAQALRIAGNYYNIIADYEKAIEYYKKAGQVYSTLNSRLGKIGFAKSKLCLGTVFDLNGDFKEALTLYLEAEPVFSGLKDYTSMLNVYNCIGNIYLQTDRYDKLKALNAKIEPILSQVDDPVAKCRYYISLTNVLRSEKRYSEAEKYFNMVRKLAEPAKYYMVLTTVEYNYGSMLTSQKRFDEALLALRKAVDYARAAGMKYEECDALYSTGLVYLEKGEPGKANDVLQNALGYAREIESKSLVKQMLKALADVKSRQGDFRQAYNYLLQYTDISQQIYSEEDQQQVNFLNAKYEAAKKESEIRQLTGEKKIRELEMEKRNTLIYLLSFLLLLLAAILFFIQQNFKNKKKISEQNLLIHEQKIKELEKEKQLAAVNSALEGEEKERSRLARDLHDGLGGLLSGAKMSFNSFRGSSIMSESGYVIDTGSAEMFEHALNLLNKSITELQRVAHNMMPQALINSGLKEAISEFCNNISAGSDFPVKFHFYGKEIKLQQKYELAIYRIIQELVNNSLKHSKASEAMVQMVQEEHRLSLVVQDNGKGFDMAILKSSAGNGISNIRTRVNTLGGIFELISSPGNGTEVSIEFENLN